MKLRRILALILTLVILSALAPTAAFADDADPYVRNITVNAGEGVSVWNTDIASSGVTSNNIIVRPSEDAFYDAVFADDSETAAVLAYCSESFRYRTDAYIKPDKDGADGMLIWIYAYSGSVTLTVDTYMSYDHEPPITPCVEDISPLEYTNLKKDQAADTLISDKCSLTNITLVLLGTVGSEIRRIINEDAGEYDTFRFTSSDVLVDSYVNGAKTGTRSLPVTCFAALGCDIYVGTKFVIPASEELRRVGTVKVTNGSAIYAAPRLKALGEANPAEWSVEPPSSVVDDIREKIKYEEDDSTLGQCTDELYKSQDSGSLDMTWAWTDGSYWLTASKRKHQVTFLPDDRNYANYVSQTDIPAKYQISFEELDGNPVWDYVSISKGGTTSQIESSLDPDASLRYSGGERFICVINGTADKATAEVGGSATVTATVPEGQRFVRWESESCEITNADQPQTTVTVAFQSSQNVTVKAILEPIDYSVTASAGAGGFVTADKVTATMREEVRVTVTPDAGYEIASVAANGGEIALTPCDGETGVYTFTMPAGDVSLTASFTKVPLTVTTSAEQGTLTADTQSAEVGDTVTLTLAPQDASHFLGSLCVRSGGADVPTTKVNNTTYTFVMPAGDVTATAVFVSNYFVCFENWNGEVLQWSDLRTGQMPAYTGATPVCEANEMYTFEFAGWDREITAVSGDDHYISYTATFTATPQSYEIKFVGADDAVLQSDVLAYGETPSYTGATPTKAADDDYVYTFAGWDKEIAPVTGAATYTATFSAVPVLCVGLNLLTLEAYVTQNNPFTPDESGYYQFCSDGDALEERFSFTDEAGDWVDMVDGGYDPDSDYHFEFVAWLEAGETYTLTTNSYSREGTLIVGVRKVDMYTVQYEQDLPHGTVDEYEELSFLAYTGQKFYPYATPDAGYGLVELTVTDSSGRRLLAEADGGYYMPASDVTVSATFAEAYTVDCYADNQVWFSTNSAVFDDWTEDNIMVERAAAGVSVEYSFGWDAGYILDEFSITTASGDTVEYGSFSPYLNRYEVWFTMPDEPITITAHVVTAYDITFDPGDGSGTPYKSAVKTGAQFALPSCPFEAPEGKAFAGWSVTVGDGAAVLMAPGEKVTMTEAARAVATYEDAACGDVNCDGNISAKDASLILQYAANFDETTGTSSIDLSDALSDVNCDGVITSLDASLILQYVANYDESTGTSTVALGPQS